MDMEIINSSDNAFIKTVVKLKEKKYRCEYGKFLLEGYRLVKDAVNSPIMSDKVLRIFVSESSYDTFGKEFKNLTVVSDKLFSKVTDTVHTSGIAAVAEIPPCKEILTSSTALYLDRVRDPGNMGTIIRTAAACGFNDVILHDCVDVYNPKTVRSSMSAILHCNFTDGYSVESVKKSGYGIVCADMHGREIQGIQREDLRNKICLVIGNEANGISDEILSAADITVALPMEKCVESLNASVSAGVLMYYLKYFI